MRYVFAGDRDIAAYVLEDLLEAGHSPCLVVVADHGGETHARVLREMVSGLAVEVVTGTDFKCERGVKKLEALKPEWLVSVHFPQLLPREVLQIPQKGCLNLHPAYLPFNRGWHTPSWAILENTPIGATLHFMSEDVDAGDIVDQVEVIVDDIDTADSLYQKLKLAERQLFRRNIEQLAGGRVTRQPQAGEGSFRRRVELFDPAIQKIDLDETLRAGDLLKRLRALTSSRREEAAYFISGGKRVRVRIELEVADD